MSFADLKNQSKFGFDALNKEIEKLQNPSNSDDRMWKPELDKSGNGYAVIRFLPAPDGEELPWAKVWSHGFQGPGGWYIENSLTTLNQKDPVAELNRQLWNSGIDADKEVARKQKRKLSYYSNIYVVSDPANPQNEGKVFIFKYGKKIFDKIMSAMNPEYQDEVAFNPFDFWAGANFRLKIKKVAGYWNYDDSSFARQTVLGDFDDSVLEKIWRSQHSLAEFTDPKNFKSYEELEARLNVVLNRGAGTRIDRETFEDEDDESYAAPSSASPFRSSQQQASSFAGMSTREPAFAGRTAASSFAYDDDEDDKLSYFSRLAEED